MSASQTRGSIGYNREREQFGLAIGAVSLVSLIVLNVATDIALYCGAGVTEKASRIHGLPTLVAIWGIIGFLAFLDTHFTCLLSLPLLFLNIGVMICDGILVVRSSLGVPIYLRIPIGLALLGCLISMVLVCTASSRTRTNSGD